MLRPLVIVTAVVACGLALALTWDQHRQLASLHAQEQRLRTQAPEAAQPIPAVPFNDPSVTLTESHTPSSELLRLRGKVGQLERRKRELAGARQDSANLQAQLAAKATNAGIPLPPGYLRKADAKFAGYDTPEHTLQTMLWAIQSRDASTLMQVFSPDVAAQIEAEIQRHPSAEEFFKDADAMPGLRITGKETENDDTVVLSVEILPGDQALAQKLRFKQFAGQWKLASR